MPTKIPGTAQQCETLELPPKIVAVYFLLLGEKVMYVGQTRNLFQRTWLHELDKDFDDVLFIRCKEEELDALERHWIEHFDPPWKSTNKYKRLPPESISGE